MNKYGSEKILPYNDREKKGLQIKRMFNSIAHAYDTLNHTLSFGFDKGWRRKGIRYLRPFSPKIVLDIATGTGDLAINICKSLQPEKVIGADISEGMMAVGKEKAKKEQVDNILSFELQDCTNLTYPDNTFDAVTAAFGVRNYENIEQGLSEMYRVLKPGGHVMILELSTPEHFPIKQGYQLYSKLVIPTIGKLISKENSAYHYLPESIKVVPQGKEMTQLLSKIGFKETNATTLTFGICSLYTGSKQ